MLILRFPLYKDTPRAVLSYNQPTTVELIPNAPCCAVGQSATHLGIPTSTMSYSSLDKYSSHPILGLVLPPAGACAGPSSSGAALLRCCCGGLRPPLRLPLGDRCFLMLPYAGAHCNAPPRPAAPNPLAGTAVSVTHAHLLLRPDPLSLPPPRAAATWLAAAEG